MKTLIGKCLVCGKSFEILSVCPKCKEEIRKLGDSINDGNSYSRNMKEIEEVMNCDVDAETKCRMISNILTAKPHYFKEKSSEIKDLSKRVEILEKQIKDDKEEQLKKLEAELNYAKFRCALPTIIDMMSHN